MRYVAFLRAVNVGGRGVVKMTDVRAAFEAAGCRNVQTFIASGNVVFDAPATLPVALRTRIAAAMTALLSAEPAILYRTVDELEALIASDPFDGTTEHGTLKLYVALMSKPPAPRPKLPFSDVKELVDVVAIRGCDAMLLSRRKPNGMFGFPNAWVESLNVVATTRNWNTIVKVVAFARR
jgi:uncharacterized protein (DUF1697 family)